MTARDPHRDPITVAPEGAHESTDAEAAPTRPAPARAGEFASAVERLLEYRQPELESALASDELRVELAGLAEVLENPVRAADWAHAPGSDAVLRRRLLELLRSEVVRGWEDRQDRLEPAHLVAVLRAFEQVRTALDPNWSQYFASRLLGPDGLELVVEVAHDLRSPLTSILFLSETLRRGQSGDVNDVQRRQLGIIYSAALGLISMASDMIELARGSDRLTETEPTPFSITEVLESVRDMVQPMAEEKGLTVRLLAPTTDRRIGYPVALSRVLLNLTTNAFKFTDEGFVEIVARAKSMNLVEFSVRDTGYGIDPEVLSTLYQPFRRSGKRGGYSFSGSGLGLAITRKLVESMGSEIHVESRRDWGTRFFFELQLPPISPI